MKNMRNKMGYTLVFLCIAAIGCYATVAQVLLIREFLNIFYGNELCLGIFWGAWFFGIAVGAFLSTKIERLFRQVSVVFVVLLCVMCFVLPVQIVFVRDVRNILGVRAGEYISLIPLLATSFGLIFPFSFIIGFIFPFSSLVVWRIARRQHEGGVDFSSGNSGRARKESKTGIPYPNEIQNGSAGYTAANIGIVYIVESLGSLVGGLLFSFYMVSKFHPFKTIVFLNAGIFFFLTGLVFFFRNEWQASFPERKSRKAKRIPEYVFLGLLLTMVIASFSAATDRLETFSQKMRWTALNPHIELVASAESKYQHIDIGRQAEQYSIYLNGHYASSFPNEYEYAQIAHLVITQHLSPRNVLLIGNGLGGLISEMLLYPVESLDYVELDQKLMDITGKYLSSADRRALADKRVTLFHQDGRYYIKNIRGKKQYDVILVNVPDPSTAFLNRFYTFEFFKEIEAVLNPDGVLATSVSSAVTYIGKEVGSYTGSLYHTLHKIFRHVLVTPGQTNYYFASNADGIVSFDIATLMKRYRECHIKSDYFNEYLFYTLLQPEQVSFIEQQLGKRKDLLVNTDKRPVTYFLNLVLWDSLTGGRLHGIFYRLQNTGLLVFLIPVFIAVAGRVIYTFMHGNFKLPKGEMPHSVPHDNKVILSDSEESDLMRQTKRHSPYHAGKFRTDCLVVLAIAGFTGLSLEIVLIYAFQNIYGYMYERVGVIVAVFMVGLALGGYVMNRLIRMSAYRLSEQSLNRKWIKILALFELGAGLYAIILPAIIQACSSYSVTAGIGLVCLVGVTGILTGFVFPLINAILIQSGKAIAVSAGATNSADHIGAFFGALLAGVFFIPIFGVWGTCLILSALNISGFVLITISALCLKGEPDVKE